MLNRLLAVIILCVVLVGEPTGVCGQVSKREVAMDLLWRAYSEYELGQIDSALAHVDSVLTIDPDLAYANIVRGTIALNNEDWKTARYYYERGLSLLYKPNQLTSPTQSVKIPAKEIEADSRCWLSLVYFRLAEQAHSRGNTKEEQSCLEKSYSSAKRGLALGADDEPRGLAEEVLRMLNPQ
jgi:tetratricopeptide (TPR) repeat protein